MMVVRISMKFRWIVVVLVLLSGMPAGASTVAAADQTLEQRGIVQAEEYLSPQFDNVVTWTSEWDVDIDGLESDSVQMIDTLSLNYKDDATVQLIFIEAGGESPEDYARRLVRYRHVSNPSAEVVLDDDQEAGYVLLYQYELEGDTIYSVIEIRLVNRSRTLQVTELLVYPEVAEPVFERVQRDIVVDGSEPFQCFDAFPAKEFEDAAP
jgi:hypothetical protein